MGNKRYSLGPIFLFGLFAVVILIGGFALNNAIETKVEAKPHIPSTDRITILSFKSGVSILCIDGYKFVGTNKGIAQFYKKAASLYYSDKPVECNNE